MQCILITVYMGDVYMGNAFHCLLVQLLILCIVRPSYRISSIVFRCILGSELVYLQRILTPISIKSVLIFNYQ